MEPNNVTIDELAKFYGTDKSSSTHRYTKYYQKYIGDWVNKNLNILEIGMGHGQSINMWLDYFRNATVCCLDIEYVKDKQWRFIQKEFKDRFVGVEGDQSDSTVLQKIVTEQGKFHIIIDDGSHIYRDQQISLGFLFPFVQTGGFYIIEDLHVKVDRSNRKKNAQTHTLLRRLVKHGKIDVKTKLKDHERKFIEEHTKSCYVWNKKIGFIEKS